MRAGYRALAAVAVVSAFVAPAIAIGAEGDDRPKQRGRLAVSVTKVGRKAAVGQPLELKSRVSWSGPAANFAYEWTSVSGPGLPPGTDFSAPSLYYPVGALEPGLSYHVRLKVVAHVPGEDGFTLEAEEDVRFTANEPPRGGSCKASARPIGPRSLQVTLSAPGWTDPDGQVQYRFELVKGKRMVGVQNWRLLSSFTTVVRLEPGESLTGRCGIRDQYGDGETLETEAIDGATEG